MIFVIAHDRKHPSKKQLALGGGVSAVLLLCKKFFRGWNFIAKGTKRRIPLQQQRWYNLIIWPDVWFRCISCNQLFAESWCAETSCYLLGRRLDWNERNMPSFHRTSKKAAKKEGRAELFLFRTFTQKNRATSRSQQFLLCFHMVVYICIWGPSQKTRLGPMTRKLCRLPPPKGKKRRNEMMVFQGS